MKSSWERTKPIIEITANQVVSKIEFFEDKVNKNTELTIEEIGYGKSSSNYRIQIIDRNYVLRMTFNRLNITNETNVRAMVIGVIPIPDILATGQLDLDYQQPVYYAILEYVRGDTLAERLHELSDLQVQQNYERAGIYLGKLHTFNFDKPGFFDEEMNITTLLDISFSGIRQTIFDFLTARVKDRLSSGIDELTDYVNSKEKLLIGIDQIPVLCHGDYNPENIMIEGTNLVAVLDWEFALSYHPFLDLGNFLRFEDNLNNPRVNRFIKGYQSGRGDSLPVDWKILVRLFDLIALLSMLNREKIGMRAMADIINRIQTYLSE